MAIFFRTASPDVSARPIPVAVRSRDNSGRAILVRISFQKGFGRLIWVRIGFPEGSSGLISVALASPNGWEDIFWCESIFPTFSQVWSGQEEGLPVADVECIPEKEGWRTRRVIRLGSRRGRGWDGNQRLKFQSSREYLCAISCEIAACGTSS